MSNQEKVRPRPNLSVLALVSFMASFIIARTFTIMYPNASLITRGYHIHHFWFGLAMILIGGWLGISLQNERTDRFASVIFGAGSGLVGDEIGLLLTFGDYWTEVTYTFILLVSSVAGTAILLRTYSKTIRVGFDNFLARDFGFYFGVFLIIVSVAFFFETGNVVTSIILGMFSVIGLLLVLAHWILVHHSPRRRANHR